MTNYSEMIKNLNQILQLKNFTRQTLADNTIKVNCQTPDDYRKMVHHMRENNIVHHTYQPKEYRAFRVVIKNLHFSTNIEEIKDELSKQGHKVRNIHNGKSCDKGAIEPILCRLGTVR